MTPLLTLPWPWDETQTQNVWIPTVRVEQKSTVTAAIDKSAALWRRVKGPHVAVAAQKQGEIMQAPAMVGTAGDGESWFF